MNRLQSLCSRALTRAHAALWLAVLCLCLTSTSAFATTTTALAQQCFQGIDPDTSAVLSGGTISAYLAGTSTPANMYTDYTGNVSAGVTVTLDGGGVACVWLHPETAYKLVIKNSAGVTLRTIDGINTAAAGNFTSLAASGNATIGGTMTVTGTAGFGVIATSSTTKVTNLNADQVDGGDFGSPPVGLGSTVRTPGTSQLTTLDVSGNANVSGTTSMAGASLTSTVSRYNNVLTTGDGLTYEVATVDLTAQTAAVITTTLYAVPATGAGQYSLSWDAKVTTAAGTSSTLGALTIVYTDPDGVVQTITAGAQTSAGAIATTSATNTTAAVLLGVPMLINAKASTNITYAFAYASNAANAMNYNLHIKLRK
jgi:hypothetical protein